MPFQSYRAKPFDHDHENHIFNYLYDTLNKEWSQKNQPLYFLGNFFINNAELDALIIKRDALIVIDFKDYGGRIKFSENGPWKADNIAVRGGSFPNPFQQIRNNKYQILNYLKKNLNFESSPNLSHIKGLCLFHRDIEFDDLALSPKINRWFNVCDRSSFLRTIDAMVSNEMKFSDLEIQSMIENFDIPIYHPDGRFSLVTPIDSIEPIETSPNVEQSRVLGEISEWLDSNETKILSLQGACHTGKRKLVKYSDKEIKDKNKRVIFLAPNISIADRYKAEFGDINSIYRWLYSNVSQERKNSKDVFVIDRDQVDIENDVIIILDAHLLGNSYFETENSIYGTGFLINDLIESFIDNGNKNSKKQGMFIENQLPKILLVGDPYQLQRGGGLVNSLIGSEAFKLHKINVSVTEIKSQDEQKNINLSLLKFQRTLIGQINSQKFIELPICDNKLIKDIGHLDDSEIYSETMNWPKNSIILCPTNEAVNSLNSFTRKKFISSEITDSLSTGDIVQIRNSVLPLEINNEIPERIEQRQFAKVISSEGITETLKTTLKGRSEEIKLDIAEATILLSNGKEKKIRYLLDYLLCQKPELTIDQIIALNIFANQEINKQPEIKQLKAKLGEKKKQLQSLTKNDQEAEKLKQFKKEYETERSKYEHRFKEYLRKNKYKNLVYLRFAYAMTVHQAQSFEPIQKIILQGNRSFDTENTATDSYFRFLYTATTCMVDSLEILDYPDLSPLSKAHWNLDQVEIKQIVTKRRFYYKKVKSLDTKIGLPKGFRDGDEILDSILTTFYKLLGDSEWEIESVNQHNYLERYNLRCGRGSVIVKLDYKKNGEVFFRERSQEDGPNELIDEVNQLIDTSPEFNDENIKVVATSIKDYLSNKKWQIITVDEKPYRLYVYAAQNKKTIKLRVDIPKKGLVSNIVLEEADSEIALSQFKKDFC